MESTTTTPAAAVFYFSYSRLFLNYSSISTNNINLLQYLIYWRALYIHAVVTTKDMHDMTYAMLSCLLDLVFFLLLFILFQIILLLPSFLPSTIILLEKKDDESVVVSSNKYTTIKIQIDFYHIVIYTTKDKNEDVNGILFLVNIIVNNK